MSENSEAQLEEATALGSIYDKDEWIQESPTSFTAILRDTYELKLHLKLPGGYPLHEPPEFSISCPELDHSDKIELTSVLNNVYLENVGEPVIYQWIESARTFLREKFSCISASRNTQEGGNTQNNEAVTVDLKKEDTFQKNASASVPDIFHGEVLVEKKSSFQAHLARVRRLEDVNLVVEELLKNKKVADATHNIRAYRFRNEKGVLVQDYDDDGEKQAGGRLLHLLELTGAQNVLVVVSRWYGGVLLGPDRFKCINNCAREILDAQGFITNKRK